MQTLSGSPHNSELGGVWGLLDDFFLDWVSLYSPGWLETCYVDQAGFRLA